MSTFVPHSSDPAPAIDLAAVKNVYLLGIGGTGMGSFAGLLKRAGYAVAGSDEGLYPPMSEMLERWQIQAFRGYATANLDAAFGQPPDLVVVGNVVRRQNPEAEELRARGLPYLSFPEALGELFLAQRTSLVVAGTHGKTTSSALLTHLLVAAGRDPSALIGGVSLDLLAEGSGNFRIGAGAEFVIEGDEYDTAYFDKSPKFLHYRPRHAILTSLEFDHADIYRNLAHYEAAFARFLALLPEQGHLAVAASQRGALSVAASAPCRVERYGIEIGDLQANHLSFRADGAHFSLSQRGRELGDFHLSCFGAQNVENALGATSVALALGVPTDALRAGLATFRGVRRRQEIIGAPRGVTVIDDFAHHPTAVRATIAAVRTRFPTNKLVAIFEPRSNTSRRKIFEADYARAFGGATEVLIVAPQGGSPVPENEQINPGALAENIAKQGAPARFFASVDEAALALSKESRSGDVLLLMSNGAFGGMPKKLLGELTARG